jgi:hypothetical protein
MTASGIAALLVRQSATTSFNNEQNPTTMKDRCNRALPDAGGGSCQGHLDRMQTAKVAAYAAFAGAGLTAIVSAILLSAAPDSESAQAHTAQLAHLLCAPNLAVDASGFGAACHVRF